MAAERETSKFQRVRTALKSAHKCSGARSRIAQRVCTQREINNSHSRCTDGVLPRFRRLSQDPLRRAPWQRHLSIPSQTRARNVAHHRENEPLRPTSKAHPNRDLSDFLAFPAYSPVFFFFFAPHFCEWMIERTRFRAAAISFSLIFVASLAASTFGGFFYPPPHCRLAFTHGMKKKENKLVNEKEKMPTRLQPTPDRRGFRFRDQPSRIFPSFLLFSLTVVWFSHISRFFFFSRA